MVEIDPCEDWDDATIAAAGEIDALRKAIEETHDREHDSVSLMWCGHELCRDDGVVSMSTAKTRSVCVDDELWEAIQDTAAAARTSVSAIVRDLLTDCVAGNLPGYTSGFVAGKAAAEEYERLHPGRLL
jgi:fructose 1,6-bisphosphatase